MVSESTGEPASHGTVMDDTTATMARPQNERKAKRAAQAAISTGTLEVPADPDTAVGDFKPRSSHNPMQEGKRRGAYMADDTEKKRIKAMKKALEDAGLVADAKGKFHCLDCEHTEFTRKSSAERHMVEVCQHRFRRFPQLAKGGPATVAAPVVQTQTIEKPEEKVTKRGQPAKGSAEAAIAKMRRPSEPELRSEVLDDTDDEELLVVEKQSPPLRVPKAAARPQTASQHVAENLSADPQTQSAPQNALAPAESLNKPANTYKKSEPLQAIIPASRSGRPIKPVERLGQEHSTPTQPRPAKPTPKPAASSTPMSAPYKGKAKKAAVPDDMVLVADIPDIPPKSPTHWVPADATMAKPEPIVPFVLINGTKMLGNSFEELWTVEEQERLIFEVQKYLKEHGGRLGVDASTWESLSWKGITWAAIKRPFNDYFKGVTQKMGTPLAQPYQLVGVVVLSRDRLFVDRTWKDLKDRSVLIWDVIAPDYAKPGSKPQPKPQEKAPEPDMRSRSSTTDSSLTSVADSEDDSDHPPSKAYIQTGPTAEQLAWRVDDNDQAPDHRNTKPRLRRPAYNADSSDSDEARYVVGGPCYICKARKSCEKWHQNLYMKVPVLKTAKATFKKAKDKEDESYQMLKPEDYEIYCDECYQLDYKQRMIPGGPCGECGATLSSEEWYDNLFLQEPTGTVYCSHCYMEDYEARKKGVVLEHKIKHDLWKGKKVDYGDGKATDEFWKSRPEHYGKDVSTNIIIKASRQDDDEMQSLEMGDGRNSAQAGRDMNATIDDETLLDETSGFTEKSLASFQDLSFSSEPDDEGSPRIARRRPAAKPSTQTAPIAPAKRPITHPTEASISDYMGPVVKRNAQTFVRVDRGHPLFRAVEDRRQVNPGTFPIPALTATVASTSRQATTPAFRGRVRNRGGVMSNPAFTPPVASISRQAAISDYRGPGQSLGGAVSIPSGSKPAYERPADPNAVGSMFYGGCHVPLDYDSDEEEL